MKRAFVFTLALVFVASSFPLMATTASARAFDTKRNVRLDTADGTTTPQRRPQRRQARQRRTEERTREATERPETNQVPDTLPPFTVREIDAAGLRQALETNRSNASGARVPLLVNFWATWCVPCREEFPDLVAINNDYAARGLAFITVSLDDATERTRSVPTFLREMRASGMPAYLLNTPEPGDAINLIDSTWSGALPATFLFNREGQIVYKHFGRITPTEVRAAIEQTLAR